MAQVQGSDQPRGRPRLPLDAKKKAKGEYLIGSGNTGWSLSEAGLAFAREHAAAVESSKPHRRGRASARIACACSASVRG